MLTFQFAVDTVRLILLRDGLSPVKWTRLVLSTSSASFDLGAEGWTQVRDGLRRALQPDALEPGGHIGELLVSWALSLSESHGRLYVASSGASTRWFWQDGAGLTVADYEVTPDTREAWIEDLLRIESDG